jgi:hypothetical protein
LLSVPVTAVTVIAVAFGVAVVTAVAAVTSVAVATTGKNQNVWLLEIS